MADSIKKINKHQKAFPSSFSFSWLLLSESKNGVIFNDIIMDNINCKEKTTNNKT